jgi:hypothetical protein
VALRCSRLRGTALRVYHCPRHESWHLTSRATWRQPPSQPPITRLGYRRAIATLLAERRTVSEQELVEAAAGGANPQHAKMIINEILNTWCRRGLAHPDRQTVIAIDVPALRAIAAHGWTAWANEQATHSTDTV